jgi:hypothetical protein
MPFLSTKQRVNRIIREGGRNDLSPWFYWARFGFMTQQDYRLELIGIQSVTVGNIPERAMSQGVEVPHPARQI